MKHGKRKDKVLDGEVLFERYYLVMGKAGSVRKLARWAALQGMINPYTGKACTGSAVWQSMWRWAFENLDAAREIYAEFLRSYGEFLSEEEWYKTVNTHVKTCLTPLGFVKFLRKHPEYDVV